MTRMTQTFFAALLLVTGLNSAQAATLTCEGAAFGEKFSVTGEFDSNAKTFVFEQVRYGEKVTVTRSRAQTLHEGCGTPEIQLDEALNVFEVTPAHIWGEYLLQFRPSEARDSGPFNANLHACQYDGSWIRYEDNFVECYVK